MDLLLTETFDGGDVVKTPKDLTVIEGFENMVYLALFGGNVEASTPSRVVDNEQSFDFWGNNLLWNNDSSLQFNSETERALKNNPLSSSGRLVIEQAVKTDLKFMSDFTDTSVSISIVTNDKIQISVTLKKPDNIQDKTFVYIWDATISELTEE